MQKFQWYLVSGASFIITLFFGVMAANRRKVCEGVVEILRQVCLERRTTYVLFGVVFFLLSVVFLISGLFHKN